MREWLFTPKARCANLAELNAHLAARCLQLALNATIRSNEPQGHRSLGGGTRGVACDAGARRLCRRHRSYLPDVPVNFERNRYSVDCRYASRVATVRAYAERIVVDGGEEMIGEHPRLRRVTCNITPGTCVAEP